MYPTENYQEYITEELYSKLNHILLRYFFTVDVLLFDIFGFDGLSSIFYLRCFIFVILILYVFLFALSTLIGHGFSFYRSSAA